MKIKQLTADNELYTHYSGQTQRQPAYLCLDLEDEVLSAYVWGNIGGGQTARAFHGLDIEWAIPPLRRRTFDELAQAVRPHCEVILKHSAVALNGSNYVGRLNEKGQDAVYEVEAAIEAFCRELEPHDIWEPWPAESYLESASDEELGITAVSTDEDIERIAGELVEEADVLLDKDDVELSLRYRRDALLQDG